MGKIEGLGSYGPTSIQGIMEQNNRSNSTQLSESLTAKLFASVLGHGILSSKLRKLATNGLKGLYNVISLRNYARNCIVFIMYKW